MRMQIVAGVDVLILHGELSVGDDRSLKPSNNLCQSDRMPVPSLGRSKVIPRRSCHTVRRSLRQFFRQEGGCFVEGL
jgi:hypothetical protein